MAPTRRWWWAALKYTDWHYRGPDKVVLTRVHGAVDGDVVFDLDLLAQWRETRANRAYDAADGNSHAFTIVELAPPR